MSTAAALLRVSTATQAGDDHHSLPEQRRRITAFAEARGIDIVQWFEAPGESASTNELDRRPVLRDLVAAANRGEFAAVIYDESSRLVRDEELAHWLINRLEARGVHLINAARDIDYYTPEGRFAFAIDAGLDAYWSRKMSTHIRKGKRGAFEAGRPVGSLPFGYRRAADGTPEQIPEEAQAVGELFRRRIAGEGYEALARVLNARGLRPRSRRGHVLFVGSSVQSILENEFYAGWIAHRGERRRGIHEPIIEQDVFHAAQRQVQRIARDGAFHADALLVGLASCSECAGPVWTTVTGPVGWRRCSYREAAKMQRRECANAGTMWSASAPDAEVAEVLRGLGTDREWLAMWQREARKQPSVVAEPFARGRIEEERRRLGELYRRGVITERDWLAEDEALVRRLQEVPAPVRQLLAAADEWAEFAEVWDAMVLDERRRAVRIVLQSVRLDTRGKRVWFEPRERYRPLFEHRAAVCAGIPPAGAGPRPAQVLYEPSELLRRPA